MNLSKVILLGKGESCKEHRVGKQCLGHFLLSELWNGL